jgi:hypothetical protein
MLGTQPAGTIALSRRWTYEQRIHLPQDACYCVLAPRGHSFEMAPRFAAIRSLTPTMEI